MRSIKDNIGNSKNRYRMDNETALALGLELNQDDSRQGNP